MNRMRKEVKDIIDIAISLMLCGVALYYNFRPPEQGVVLWWILVVLVLIFIGQKK